MFLRLNTKLKRSIFYDISIVFNISVLLKFICPLYDLKIRKKYLSLKFSKLKIYFKVVEII